MTEYETVKVSRVVKADLDRIKIEMGLPSSSQTVTTLIQQYKTKREIIDEIKKDLVEEASKIIIMQFYHKIFEILGQINKPASEITLFDLVDILKNQ